MGEAADPTAHLQMHPQENPHFPLKGKKNLTVCVALQTMHLNKKYLFYQTFFNRDFLEQVAECKSSFSERTESSKRDNVRFILILSASILCFAVV